MAIEARSLSSLTQLASNPPSYPHNPSETPSPPLTLYIVRVPGSRDVFLSPLKPKEKVVNAHDVQSSLYFLHINDLQDDRLAGVAPTQDFDLSMERGNSLRVTRKPLPTPPTTPEMECPMTSQEMKVASPIQPFGVPKRKPVLPRRSSARDRLTVSPQRAPQPAKSHEESNCLTLTLIRRDPGSGAQWNVAKIRDPPVEDISSESTVGDSIGAKSKSSGVPLYIDINNPGYSKFLCNDGPTTSDNSFKRRLWMDGSRYADHTYSQRSHVSSDNGGGQLRPSLQSTGASWRSSRTPVDRRTHSYAFQSPWGGKCEFSSGVAGRSLRCHHRLVAAVSNEECIAGVSELRFNLPTGGHSGRSGQASVDLEAGSAASSYFTHDPVQGHRYTKSEPAYDPEPHWTSIRDENGDIDYSLGRERAGGGFGGKQAKLGKLIIEDEGQKMLDLVVAANMALWWRAYNRM